jgi:hypothetical protein
MGCCSCIFNILSKMIMKATPPTNFEICAFNNTCDMITLVTWSYFPVYIPTLAQKSALSTECENPNPTKSWGSIYLDNFLQLLNLRQSHDPPYFVTCAHATIVTTETILCINKTISISSDFIRRVGF